MDKKKKRDKDNDRSVLNNNGDTNGGTTSDSIATQKCITV